ncbi:MAG: molybdate ABC transporter substrate-binding protein [Acidobacteriota bacterium]
MRRREAISERGQPRTRRGFRGPGWFLVSLIAVTIASCVMEGGPAGSGENPSVLAFVASSLGEPVETLGRSFEAETGIHVDVSAASSVLLARQIAAGAPADLFIAAGPGPVEDLVRSGHAAASGRRDVLGNRLVVIVGADATVDPRSPVDLVGLGKRVAIGDPETVPVGNYARAALRAAGVWNDLEPDLARAGSARAVLAWVESGAASVGVVYETDARAGSAVEVAFAFDPASYPPIVYPAVIPSGAPHRDAARRFRAFLSSPAATAMFRESGFLILSGSSPGSPEG